MSWILGIRKKVLLWFLDWPILVIEALALVWVSWPFYHHVIGYFWMSILIYVLAVELVVNIKE